MSFRWTPINEKAAQLLAEANLDITEIAEACGVARSTVYEWKKDAEFAARVAATLDEIRAEIRRHGIATVEKRVAVVNDRWKRLRRIIEARADDPVMQGVPGGTTGLLVRHQKMVGSGENATLIEEFKLDTGLLSELREHEKQAAQELGQWAQKIEVGDSKINDALDESDAIAAHEFSPDNPTGLPLGPIEV